MKNIFASFLFIIGCTVSGFTQNSDMNVIIDSLMNEMTLQEKIGQLNLITPGGGIPTGSVVSSGVEEKIRNGQVGGIFGISGPNKVRETQNLAIKNSRLGIPLLVGSDIIHGYKTTFPIPLALSCSWDMELIEHTARVAAQEATADGIFWNFSPMVDIARDPRWGRIAEGGGEDPYLGSQIARAMVKGYQGDDLTKENTMMATVKHFALYGASEAGRDYNTVDMSRLRMYNDYMPPYKAAIDAGAGCVMSSFNDVDGVPASGNKWLLSELLREQWQFDGFVVSDYTSVNEMMEHGLGNLQQVSALSVNAGLDMDMVGEGFLKTLEKSVEEGLVTEEIIDIACRRILEAKYKLGLFTNVYRYTDNSRPTVDILTTGNRDFARKAAAQSCVLLKNSEQLLPLSKNGKIALIGSLANSQNNMLGTWAPTGDPKLAIPILQGFQNLEDAQLEISYAKGANISNDSEFAEKVNVFGKRIEIDKKSPEQLLKEALKVAKKADVIVAVIGEATEMSGESASRSDITIPESQKVLIRALAKIEKPLVIILMCGRPMAIEEELELADALLLTWHPGIEAGNAIADVVFGNYNPSGKLSTTFPRNVGQIPIYYSSKSTGRPQNGDTFEKFKTNYLDVENSPLLPFGYGLSYTQFEYSKMELSAKDISQNETITASIQIRNSGNSDGAEIVQLYIQDEVASITRPVKQLKGFKKVFLTKGETKTVSFEIGLNELSFYDFEGDLLCEPGKFKVMIGGDSNELNVAHFELK